MLPLLQGSYRSWNFIIMHFTGLESSEIKVWVMESHGKPISFLGMNKEKKCKIEKATDLSENQLIPVKR